MTDATTYDFACGDIMDGCAATFRGSRDDVFEQVATHARDTHGIDQLTPELTTVVEEQLQPVA